MNHSINYRSDIDGLRAVAVLFVLFFHAFPTLVKGGFIGVDIFFVISGFLISSLIFQGLKQEKFSYLHFYSRRIKRIFPALILILFVCLIMGRYLLFSDDYHILGRHVAANAAFLGNFSAWKEMGNYFLSPDNFKPLLHLWSLGIEEQFYLTWPLLLVLFWKHPLKLLLIICCFFSLSFLLNIALVNIFPSATFYLPFTRFWELLAGSMLAYVIERNDEINFLFVKFKSVFSNQKLITVEILSCVGLLFIIFAMIFIDQYKTFPGYWALLPTFGTLLLLASGPEAWINQNILSNRILVFIGLISYPLYLWHWPIFSFLRIEYGEIPILAKVIAILFCCILSWLTYELIEKPIRFGKSSFFKLKTPMLCFLMTIVGFWGFLVMENKLMKNNLNPMQKEYLQYFNNEAPTFSYYSKEDIFKKYRIDCGFNENPFTSKLYTIEKNCIYSNTTKKIFLWGDSHAQHFYYGLFKTLPAEFSILQITTQACRPSTHFNLHPQMPVCNESNKFALLQIKREKPDFVVLAQADGHEYNDWDSLITTLRGAGVKHILIVGPVPQWTPYLYKIIIKKYFDRTPLRLQAGLDTSILRTDKIVKKTIQTKFNFPDVTYISLIDRLCNKDGCPTYLNGNKREGLFTNDYGHLTPLSSQYVAKNILTPVIVKIDHKK